MTFMGGDRGMVSAFNQYYLIVGLGLLAPLFFGYMVFLHGFGFIGLLSSSEGSTLLPPLLYLLPVGLTIMIAAIEFGTYDRAFLPGLVLLQIAALLTTIVLIFVPTWRLFFACLEGTISCSTGWDFAIHGIAFVLSFILLASLILSTISIIDFYRRSNMRDRMLAYDALAYQDLTGDTIVVDDEDLPVPSNNNIRSDAPISRNKTTSRSSTSARYRDKKPTGSRKTMFQ